MIPANDNNHLQNWNVFKTIIWTFRGPTGYTRAGGFIYMDEAHLYDFKKLKGEP